MKPETELIVKVIAGTVLVIALIIGFLERWFRPSYIVLETSYLHSWMEWLGWGMAAVATLTYIFVDFLAWKRHRSPGR